jgi:hypothetical protein
MFKPLHNYPQSRLKYAILANSVAVSIGSAITAVTTPGTTEDTRYVKPASTGTPVLGVVVGFGTGDGAKVYKSFKGSSTVTTASDNTTNAKIGVWYVPAADRNIDFVADVDNTLGTTPGSTGIGAFALVGANTLGESTYVEVGGVGYPKDFISYGALKGETKKVVGRFANVI